MSDHRDPVVGDALRRMDVPDHEPGFWRRLQADLAATATRTADADVTPPTDAREEAATVVDLERPAPNALAAARGRAPLLALAAAAVVVAVALVAGTALLGGDGDQDAELDAADPTRVTEPTDPDVTAPEQTTTDPPPETTTTTAVPGVRPEDAEATAVAWIEALRAGDVDAAYAQLDDASRAGMTRAEFQELRSGLAEGAAAFGADGVSRDVTVLDAPDAAFAVVTFTGEVEREGTVETAAYPVVVTGSGVHFTLGGPQLELDPEYARSSGTTLASPLVLLVSDTALSWVWYDGGAPERLERFGTVDLDVEAAAGPGTHLVSAVALEGGRITARAYTVVVP